mgnify:CR=1 FL=1
MESVATKKIMQPCALQLRVATSILFAHPEARLASAAHAHASLTTSFRCQTQQLQPLRSDYNKTILSQGCGTLPDKQMSHSNCSAGMISTNAHSQKFTHGKTAAAANCTASASDTAATGHKRPLLQHMARLLLVPPASDSRAHTGP